MRTRWSFLSIELSLGRKRVCWSFQEVNGPLRFQYEGSSRAHSLVQSGRVCRHEDNSSRHRASQAPRPRGLLRRRHRRHRSRSAVDQNRNWFVTFGSTSTRSLTTRTHSIEKFMNLHLLFQEMTFPSGCNVRAGTIKRQAT